MKIQLVRCDRCKEAITGEAVFYNFTGPYHDFDLCQKCTAELDYWLNGGTDDDASKDFSTS